MSSFLNSSKWIIFCFLLLAQLVLAGESRNFYGLRHKHKEIKERLQQEEKIHAQTIPAMIGAESVNRRRLADLGITFVSNYVTDMLANPIGGKARGFAYAGSYGLSANIDFTKAGIKGLDLFGSAVWRTGTNLSQRKIDNQFPVAQVFGSQTVKLNELYLAQILLDDRIEIKAGRLNAGNNFFCSPLYWYYVNNAFDGNPISIFFNVPFTAYPNSTWGAYLMLKPLQRLSAQFAVYNANSKIKANKYHGVNFTFKSTNGVIWITEWCLLIGQEKGDTMFPGNYKAGYFYQTGDARKFTGGEQNGDPCFYLLFDQMIYRKHGPGTMQGITPFISLIFMPDNRNLFPIFFNCGIHFKGISDKRPDDALNFGYVYGKYSRDQARIQSQNNIEPQNFESVFEANYWVQINPWFYIAPDFQYILHPKGRDTPNAYVIGAQIGIDIW